MTTDKTKAALVALRDHVNKHVTQWDNAANGSHHHPIWVMVADALTAQAEAQPADDEVREAIGEVEKALDFTHEYPPSDFVPVKRKYATALIRAASENAYLRTLIDVEKSGEALAKERYDAFEQGLEYGRAATSPKNTDAQRQVALDAFQKWPTFARYVGGDVMIRRWRNSQQIAGYQRLLAGAVAGRNGAEIVIDLKTAKALIEICEQAAHTERNHEPNQ